MASPAPAAAPEHEDDLIRPARDGTLRVLRASQAAGVTRVVMTSSVAAIVYCERRGRGELLDENDWSEPELLHSAYAKSKTVAERAAWEFIEGLSGRPGRWSWSRRTRATCSARLCWAVTTLRMSSSPS